VKWTAKARRDLSKSVEKSRDSQAGHVPEIADSVPGRSPASLLGCVFAVFYRPDEGRGPRAGDAEKVGGTLLTCIDGLPVVSLSSRGPD
jgi:hypothetical protein